MKFYFQKIPKINSVKLIHIISRVFRSGHFIKFSGQLLCSVQLFVYIFYVFLGVHEQSYIAHAIEYAAGWNNADHIAQSRAMAIGALVLTQINLVFLFTF